MSAACIRFYVTESQRHGGRLLSDWLLERAQALGVPGGTALRAIAGYGRHGRMHQETFFELAGDLPVEVEFIAEAAQADALLELLREEGLRLFYVRMPVESGLSGDA